MEEPSHAVSDTWPAANPALSAALIGSILAAQGFTAPLDRPGSQPWRMTEFDRCAGWIAKALKDQSLTVDDVRDGVSKGWFQMFHAPEGVMVTECIVSPRLRAIHVIAAGGSLRAMTELVPKVEHFAHLAGANFGGATGRKGWVRWLRSFGYAPSKLYTVEKALS